jgi:hypothetical protein
MDVQIVFVDDWFALGGVFVSQGSQPIGRKKVACIKEDEVHINGIVL